MLDICACLITLLQDHPELTAHLMELGFPRKMKDNIDSLNPSSPAYELSLLVLCALLRSPSVLHRTAVLSLAVGTAGHNDTSVRASPFMVSSACSNNSASTSGGFHSQLQQQQQRRKTIRDRVRVVCLLSRHLIHRAHVLVALWTADLSCASLLNFRSVACTL